eukprot:1184862-Prorocentrum_minimum.AAC.2
MAYVTLMGKWRTRLSLTIQREVANLNAGVRVPRLMWTPAGPSRAGAQGCDKHQSRSGRSGSCEASRMGACALPIPGEDSAKLQATYNPSW